MRGWRLRTPRNRHLIIIILNESTNEIIIWTVPFCIWRPILITIEPETFFIVTMKTVVRSKYSIYILGVYIPNPTWILWHCSGKSVAYVVAMGNSMLQFSWCDCDDMIYYVSNCFPIGFKFKSNFYFLFSVLIFEFHKFMIIIIIVTSFHFCSWEQEFSPNYAGKKWENVRYIANFTEIKSDFRRKTNFYCSIVGTWFVVVGAVVVWSDCEWTN